MTIGSVVDALRLLQEMESSNSIGQRDNSRVHFPFPFGLWFRGQASAEWRLEPSVFRKRAGFTYLNEARLFNNFRLRSPRLPDSASTFDWLCLMQHYGLPTRILDWTESLLVALYFATEEAGYRDVDGALVVLNAPRLNEMAASRAGLRDKRRTIHIPEDFECVSRSEMARTARVAHYLSARPIRSGYFAPATDADDRTLLLGLSTPVAVFPWRRHDRMSLQSSVVTVHGGKTFSYGEDALPAPVTLEELNDESPLCSTIMIPSDRKAAIQRELAMLGVHRASLFPELDAQSAFLQSQWAVRADPDGEP